MIYAIVGIAGVVLSFGNLAGISDYFNNPGFYRDYLLDASSTWQGLAAVLLKPFLGLAVIMGWCKWVDSGGRNASWLGRGLTTVLMLVGVVLTLSMVGYNRGVFAVPVVALATVALAKRDKASWRLMAAGGLLLLFLMPAYAIYRSGSELGEDFLKKADLETLLLEKADLSEIVQMYGGAPQYLGFLLERSHWGRDPHWGGVSLSSVLSPVPVFGKIFRRQSGFAIYNRLIYGTDAIADQVVPFVGETFLDFHVVGVLLGAMLVGWGLYRLQRAFEGARSSLEVYIWQYLSAWVCFLIFGSVSVVSQILIYSCWPIYTFWYLNRKSRPVARLRAVTTQEG